MQLHGFLAVLSLALCRHALAAAGDDWSKWTIYQVMTDRFAQTSGSTTATCDTGSQVYCGGTWAGITNQLDYIEGMGFDAIWISPITAQLQGNTADGSSYHGYWQTDIDAVNTNFGSSADLVALSAALHNRGMKLMVDIVVNHYAWLGTPDSVDYSTFGPFDDESYFHPYCAIDYSEYTDTTQLEQCWMGDTIVPLPDLKTEVSNVSSVWNSWIEGIVSQYNIDGLRIDSVMEVNTGFWSAFQSAAGVYSLGEVYEGDSSFVCGFQDYLPGVFNYAMYYPLLAAFESTTGSIGDLADMIDTIKSCPDTSQLGTFSENHDQPRFAALNSDMTLAQNLITFTMLTDGIPVIYQGQEQHYSATGGTSTPYNREAIWLSGYNTDAELYVLIKKLNNARHAAIAADSSYPTEQNTHIYQDLHTMAMKKGNVLTVVTNDGSSGSDWTLSVASGYDGGTEVTELLTCDTLTTDDDGTLDIPISAGLPRVYLPTSSLNGCDADSGATLAKKRKMRRNSAKFRNLEEQQEEP